MFDLLGTVPTQQVQHGRIDVGLVQFGGIEHPIAQKRRQMFGGGDQCEPFDEAVLAVTGSVSESSAEEKLHLVDVRIDIDAVCSELIVDLGVCLRVHGFLTDETDDIVAQLVVVNERQRFFERTHEPLLPFGKK